MRSGRPNRLKPWSISFFRFSATWQETSSGRVPFFYPRAKRMLSIPSNKEKEESYYEPRGGDGFILTDDYWLVGEVNIGQRNRAGYHPDRRMATPTQG